MARNKKTEEEVVVSKKVVDDFMDLPTVPNYKSASVFSDNGTFIRTYTKEVHGENFVELANGYANKIKGSMKVL
jgi:hypothetical protein